ncbi:MAG: hypothetical protein GY820_20570 [Gammaproteobacteria bacterium]|nr:hypothetical protein [Gammaproteobacteria bacterium]
MRRIVSQQKGGHEKRQEKYSDLKQLHLVTLIPLRKHGFANCNTISLRRTKVRKRMQSNGSRMPLFNVSLDFLNDYDDALFLMVSASAQNHLCLLAFPGSGEVLFHRHTDLHGGPKKVAPPWGVFPFLDFGRTDCLEIYLGNTFNMFHTVQKIFSFAFL